MKEKKLKSRSVGLILLLFVALLLPSMSMAQFRMWQGGLFVMGPTPEEMEQMSQQEEFFKERGYRGGLFNPAGHSNYNIWTQHFGDDVNGGFNIGTQLFGQEAPLGGGWLVLTMAGAAYAYKKRKNNHNKQ